MGRNFVENNKQHDDAVKEIANSLKGQIFKRAPFDLVLEDGRFIEVKTNMGRNNHLWRIRVSNEEYRFGKIQNLWILIKNVQGTFLFPMDKIILQLEKTKSVKDFNGIEKREVSVRKIIKKYAQKI